MEVFAHFDIINSYGVKVAEGHKASFCLEDNQCTHDTEPVYKCANHGDQGISVNCTDTYHHNIDCQWIDITDIDPGIYTFKVYIQLFFSAPRNPYIKFISGPTASDWLALYHSFKFSVKSIALVASLSCHLKPTKGSSMSLYCMRYVHQETANEMLGLL